MPEPVKPQDQDPALQDAPKEQQQAQSTKESNAEKISKAQQGATSFLAKKLLESSKMRKEEAKDEQESEVDDGKKQDESDDEKPEPKKESKAVEKKEDGDDDSAEQKTKSRREKNAEVERKEVSTDDIAEAAARGVAKALQGDKHPEKKGSAKEYSKDDLPDEFAEVYDELLALPKLGGKWKDRDIVAEVVEHSRAIDKYKAAWQKKNKGHEFDPSDEEHADFMAEHSIEIPQQDLIKAARSVAENNAKNAAVEKVREEFGGDIEEIRAQKKLNSLRPVIAQTEASVDEAIASAIGDDVVAAVKKGGEEVKKLADSHPYLAEVAGAVAPEARGFADAAVQIISGIEKFDPKNRMHDQFRNDLFAIEKRIDSMDAPPKLPDGREFITLEGFSKLSPRSQQGYYTVSDVDAIPVVVGTFAKKLAEDAAGVWKSRHERWLKANGGVSKESSGTPSKKDEPRADHKPAPTVTPTASKIDPAKSEEKPKNAASFMARRHLERGKN